MLAAERVEIERKEIINIAATLRLRTDSANEVMNEVIGVVTSKFRVTAAEIRGRSRMKHVSLARHAYCYLCSKLDPACTLSSVGRSIGRDHSTVINSVNKCDALRATDPEFTAMFNQCLKEVVNCNEDYLSRMEQGLIEKKSYIRKKNDWSKALNALDIVFDFMHVFNEHEAREAMGLETVFYKKMVDLRDKAIKMGF